MKLLRALLSAPSARIIGLACFGVAAPAFAASSSVDERLARLEDSVRVLTEENAALRHQLSAQPDAPASAAARAAGTEAKLTVGGFVQGQAEFGRAPDSRFAGIRDRFFFRRARIAVGGSFAEPFDFKAEIDLGGNSLGAGSGFRVQANEIFVNWRRYDAANIRFGQLKPAFGAEQLASDTKTLTIERSLMNDRLTDGRQLALGMTGDFFGKRLSYVAVIGNGTGSNNSANDNSKFQRSVRLQGVAFAGTLAGVKSKLTLGANALWTEDNGLAKSGYNFDSAPGGTIDQLFTGKRNLRGVDAWWSWGGLDLTGELLEGTFHPVAALPAATVDARGWQATSAWFVVPGRLQAVVRREAFDPRRATGGDATTEWLYGLNYLVKGDDLKLMLNYVRGQAPDTPNSGGRLLARVQVIY